MNPHDYSYSFLRYCQDREAGEFANIGVLFWCPQDRFLGFRGSHRYARLTHFFDDLDRDGYRLLVAHVERRFDHMAEEILHGLPLDSLPASARELAFKVVPEDDGSLLWSPARGGLTADPAAELTQVYDRFIGKHHEVKEATRREDQDVFRQVFRPIFTSPKLAGKIHEHEVAAPLARHVFKNAWKNGVWNVYETLSFDLTDPDSIDRKAYTWHSRSEFLSQASEAPKLHYLLGKPTLPGNARHYGRAKDILNSCKGITLIEEDEAADFGRDLESRVLSSEHE
ncbi:DUF3037 domain-containing protein [Prosthecobacter sp.]|uniref:DUF3037 domain-containing protein n=1 Tax=Prosthecobacter sp. TaxID=1965333 RepID=UPI0037839DFA